MPQLFFRPKYVWFPIHLAELIVYITSTRVDLYSHQMLLHSKMWDIGVAMPVFLLSLTISSLYTLNICGYFQ